MNLPKRSEKSHAFLKNFLENTPSPDELTNETVRAVFEHVGVVQKENESFRDYIDRALYEKQRLVGRKQVNLAERIRFFQENGLRWNNGNIRPKSQSAVERKVKDWQENYEKGLEADPTTLTEADFDTLDKAFVLGVCMASEGGVKPCNSLKTRFKKALGKFNQVREEEENEEPPNLL